MSVETPDELIARYREAYERATGRVSRSEIAHRRGWFVFESFLQPIRYRRFEVQSMISTLNARSVPPSTAETEEVGR